MPTPTTINFSEATPEEIEAFLTKGHGADRLRFVFSCIENMDGWKLPVDCKVSANVRSISDEEILASIDFMVGGQGTIEILDDGTRHVRAPGYYALIGA